MGRDVAYSGDCGNNPRHRAFFLSFVGPDIWLAAFSAGLGGFAFQQELAGPPQQVHRQPRHDQQAGGDLPAGHGLAQQQAEAPMPNTGTSKDSGATVPAG